MANAKEYKDLTEAASIDTDALVALAQPNAPELQTSKMSALAAKIQEINTAGPLAELELATSIGKQQLAEALTEKGVPTTANETEIQMADKVRGLQTTSDANKLTTALMYANGNISSISLGTSAYVALGNEDLVFLYNNELLYLDHTIEYPNLAAMLAGATSRVACTPTLGKYTVLRSSINRRYIAVPLSYTSVSFYEVDTNNKTISLIKNVTLSTGIWNYSTQTAVDIAITNDGKYYIYVGTDKLIHVYDITAETVTVKSSAININSQFTAAATIIEDNDTSGCMILNAGDGSTGDLWQYNIEYTKSANEFQLVNIVRNIKIPGVYIGPQFYGFGLVYGTEIIQNGYIKKYSITVYELKTQTVVGTFSCLYTKRSKSIKVDTSSGAGQVASLRMLKNADGTYRIYTPCKSLDITMDPINKKFTFNDTVGILVVTNEADPYTESSSQQYIIQVLMKTPSGKVIGTSGDSDVSLTQNNAPYSANGTKGGYQFISDIKYKQYAGTLRTNNGIQVYYLDPYVTQDAITAGAYDLNTTVIPLPADSQSQQEAN